MIHRISTLTASSIACLSAFAQAPFARTYKDVTDTLNYANTYAQLARTSTSDLLLVNDLGQLQNDRTIYPKRLATDGSVQWARRILVTGANHWNITDMAALTDGSMVITGEDGLHGLFLRLDPSGTPVAAKWYSATGISAATTLYVVNDSAIVLFGDRRNGSSSNGWLAVVDQNGALISTASFQIAGQELAPVQVLDLSGNSVLMLGRSDEFVTPFHKAVAVCSLDTTAGLMNWAVQLSNTAMPVLRPVGAMVLADGSSRIVMRNEMGLSSTSTVVAALSASGALLWTKELHPKRGTWDMYPLSVTPMSATTLAITGYYDPAHSGVLLLDTSATVVTQTSWNSVLIANEGISDGSGGLWIAAHSPVSGSFDPALIHTDNDLSLCASSATSITTNTIVMDTASNVVQSGYSLSVVDVLGDLTTITFTPLITTLCTSTGINDESGSSTAPLLAPNPAFDRLSINAPSIQRIDIIDAIGRMMLSRSFQDEASIDLNISTLAAGLYHVRMLTRDGWRSSALIKE